MERAATSLPSIDICAQGNDRRWPAGGMQHNLLDGGFEQIEAHEYLGSRRSRSHGFTVRSIKLQIRGFGVQPCALRTREQLLPCTVPILTTDFRKLRSCFGAFRPAGKATNHRRAKAEYSIKYKQQNDSHYKKANTR
jgi:hypothetical protein